VGLLRVGEVGEGQPMWLRNTIRLGLSRRHGPADGVFEGDVSLATSPMGRRPSRRLEALHAVVRVAELRRPVDGDVVVVEM